jgi:hypothetical protein
VNKPVYSSALGNALAFAWYVWNWQVLRLRAALPVANVNGSIAGALGNEGISALRPFIFKEQY